MKYISMTLIALLAPAALGGHTLSFKPTKSGGWSLRADFLAEIARIFNVDVFVESGTSYGGTVNAAKDIFKEIHSIELDDTFFARACDRFLLDENVYLHKGDSAIVLTDVLRRVKNKRIVCWFDGHYSGGTTAKGTSNTPILHELRALEQANIHNAILLIDDICCFRPPIRQAPDVAQGYPSIQELKDAVMRINSTYRFVVYGDIALAYPSSCNVEVSPLIEAMTISRFFDDVSQSYESIFNAEAIIATKTSPEELEALWDNCTYHFGSHRAHAYLWYALSLFTAQRYGEAYDNFLQVLDAGYTDWRVSWYAMQAAYRSGKDFTPLAKTLISVCDGDFAATKFFLHALI
jgi:hypothetical protein